MKVFRTAIGFHDAYVAASSKKAALAAWGASSDLFARGVAEIVTDPKLSAEPLALPGVVLKVSRGSAKEQLAALGTAAPAEKGKRVINKTRRDGRKPEAPRKKTMKRPSRVTLDEAEAAIAELEERHRSELGAIAAQEADLKRQRVALEEAQATKVKQSVERRDTLDAAYRRAIEKWQLT